VRRDDLEIDCFLTFPPRFDRGRRYPLILNVHGGPNGFFAPGWMPQVQALAAQGYLVLSTNPRGSASFGADFMASVFEDWGGEDYDDQMAAVDRVLQRSYVDGRRLGVMGYSYGGFMTSWIIGHTNRFKSAIVGAPVTNLYSMYGTTDIAVSFGERQWGGPPWTNLGAYAKHSPITYARNVETPVLLMHGELDIRCPIAQSEEYYVALKRLGKQVEFIRFPGGYHGFPNAGHPKLRQAFLDEQLVWWKQTL
jgi:dipeptidyl aminopeptidase/acylaminoacyl peptidase